MINKKFKLACKKSFSVTMLVVLITALLIPVYFTFTDKMATTTQIHNWLYTPPINSDDQIQPPVDYKEDNGMDVIIVPSEDTDDDLVELIEIETSQMCFIGDERTVWMEDSVFTDVQFLSTESADINWLKDYGIFSFSQMQQDVDLCAIALGLNDINHYATVSDEYVSVLNDLSQQYPDKIFVFINVGPVDEAKEPRITNADIEAFNERMKVGLNHNWQIVDQYKYVAAEGCNPEDGRLYSSQESAKIFMWIVNSIKNQKIK